MRQDFAHDDVDEILAVLDRYGVRTHEAEIHRVHLAVLKLSDGDRASLESDVEAAKRDYRDLLAYAEYPAEWALGASSAETPGARELAQARRDDEEQYRDWLNEL